MGEEVWREGGVRNGSGGQWCGGPAGRGGGFDVALHWTNLNSIHTLRRRVDKSIERESVKLLRVLRVLLLENSFLEDGAHLVGEETEERAGEENGEDPLKLAESETIFEQKENTVCQQTEWCTCKQSTFPGILTTHTHTFGSSVNTHSKQAVFLKAQSTCSFLFHTEISIFGYNTHSIMKTRDPSVNQPNREYVFSYTLHWFGCRPHWFVCRTTVAPPWTMFCRS